jgi:hypothetical protein
VSDAIVDVDRNLPAEPKPNIGNAKGRRSLTLTLNHTRHFHPTQAAPPNYSSSSVGYRLSPTRRCPHHAHNKPLDCGEDGVYKFH